MRIALTNPFCWPQVRRGSERLLHDLAAYLHRRGHEVSVITSAPTGTEPEFPPEIETIVWRQRWQALDFGRWTGPGIAFARFCRHTLLHRDFEVVHCLHHFDAYGAALARAAPATKFKLVHQFMGIPVRRYFLPAPHELLMFRTVLKHADHILVLSRYAAFTLERDFAAKATTIPLPVEMASFRNTAKAVPADWPSIVFLGDVGEPRKGALPCAEAFAGLKDSFPDAVLHFCGNAPARDVERIVAAVPPDVRDSIRFHGAVPPSDLPRHLASATVMALPSMWEAFGVVFAEALASGTPVVGCQHGGVPDIVDDSRIGVLVDPGQARGVLQDVDALVEALRTAVALAQDPATEACCRTHAARFGWDRLGPSYEALYEHLLAEGS